MRQALFSPTTSQGVIANSCFMDTDLIREFQENAENPTIASAVIPGGGNDINHDICQADLLFGLKNCRNGNIAEAESKELAITSLAGFHWGRYCSQQEAEDQFYFIGVALTEQRLTAPLDGTTYDPDNGPAYLMAGATSVVLNGPFPVYAGNLVCWRAPVLPFHPKARDGLFNGGDAINKMARGGQPATKFQFEIVPFDYSDFSVQFAGSFAAFQDTRDNNGIADIPYEWTLCNSDQSSKRSFSNIQDQALAFKFGLIGNGLRLVETLIRRGVLQLGGGIRNDRAREQTAEIANQIGLFDTKTPAENSILMEALADMFMLNISNGDPLRNAAETRAGGIEAIRNTAMSVPNDNAAAKYDRLRLHSLDQLVQGIALAWHSKTEKIIGRAFNCAAQSDTLDVCFGHYGL